MKKLWQKVCFITVKDKEDKKMSQITIRSDRKDDYTFYYKGDEVTLGAGKIISIATGLDDVVLPTCAMKIINNLIVIKEDVKHKHHDEEEK